MSEHDSWRWVLKKPAATAPADAPTGAPGEDAAVRLMRTGTANEEDGAVLTKVWLGSHDVSIAERATCFRLGLQHPLRRACLHIVRWQHLEALVMATVLLNAAALLLYDPMSAPSSGRNAVLHKLEIAFNIAFTLETAVKMTAWGVWGHPSSYLASIWNRLDVFIVTIAWVPMLGSLAAARAR